MIGVSKKFATKFFRRLGMANKVLRWTCPNGDGRDIAPHHKGNIWCRKCDRWYRVGDGRIDRKIDAENG